MRAMMLMVMLLPMFGCKTYELTNAEPISEQGYGYHPLRTPPLKGNRRSGLFHLSCTDRYSAAHDSVYAVLDKNSSKQIYPTRGELAKRHYLHAAMSSNVYRSPKKKPIFRIPGWTVIEEKTSLSGFGMQLYGDRGKDEKSERLVVAYRGTDFSSIKDWGNNLALREPAQYSEAYRELKRIRSENPDASITVTGHSLGGGIALNMSLRFNGIDAVVFNASPRFYFADASNAYDNNRVFLHERGELLNGLFGNWSELRLPNQTSYGNYSFLDYTVRSISPVQEHGIYEFTRGLVVVAMTRGELHAQQMFAANINIDEAKQKDWANCQRYFVQN